MVPVPEPSALDAFAAAAANLSAVLATVTEAEVRPAHPVCVPWTARAPLAHVGTAALPVDRLVRTRHGDAMLLRDFMVTRVVELAVHRPDLADALDGPPWTHDSAVEVVTRCCCRPSTAAAPS